MGALLHLIQQGGAWKMVPFESLVRFPVRILQIMALSCIISEIKRDIGRKWRFFIPPIFDAPVRGSPSELPYRLAVKKTMLRVVTGWWEKCEASWQVLRKNLKKKLNYTPKGCGPGHILRCCTFMQLSHLLSIGLVTDRWRIRHSLVPLQVANRMFRPTQLPTPSGTWSD